MTGAEKKKYNRALQTGEDAGLRIRDNSILVECENDSKYQYKYVVYDDMEDGPVICDVYAIGRIDPMWRMMSLHSVTKLQDCLTDWRILDMITGNMFKRYVDISCKILHIYSHDIIIEILDFMSSDEAVLKMDEILSTNPSEGELLDKIHELQED